MSDPDTAIYLFPPKPTLLSIDGKTYYHEKIKCLLKERNTMMVAHYYIDLEIQQLAEETGGYISDSLEMARFGVKYPASTLLVIGVGFMGETAKIPNPKKTILMSTFQAECSLDLGYPAEEFSVFCDAHPDRTIVVYANTFATAKARVDWVVTSSVSVGPIGHLDSLGEKTIQTPDKHLGRHVQKQTGGNILRWQGTCIVHDESETQALTRLQEEYPNVVILVHPESPQAIVNIADVAGSTSQLVAAAKALPHQRPIVATDRGIFHKMRQAVPDKELLEAPTAGEGATCRNCAHCPWMAMNGFRFVTEALEQEGNSHEVHVGKRLRERTLMPLNRILNLAVTLRGQRIIRRNVTPWRKGGFF